MRVAVTFTSGVSNFSDPPTRPPRPPRPPWHVVFTYPTTTAALQRPEPPNNNAPPRRSQLKTPRRSVAEASVAAGRGNVFCDRHPRDAVTSLLHPQSSLAPVPEARSLLRQNSRRLTTPLSAIHDRSKKRIPPRRPGSDAARLPETQTERAGSTLS